MNKIKKKQNRQRVARLFEKRTGVPYQNWIQAWYITEKMKNNVKS